eukprot:1381084-Amphidinium_carterae.2
MARNIEPEPELDTAISVPVPILLDLEGLGLRAPSRLYVVWRLEGSPEGDYTFSGVHSGYPSWEGIQSLLASGSYLAGRDRLRRVEAPGGGDLLAAATQLYLDEAGVHGAPTRVRIWYWPCSCEAELCRRVQLRRRSSRVLSSQGSSPSSIRTSRRRHSP